MSSASVVHMTDVPKPNNRKELRNGPKMDIIKRHLSIKVNEINISYDGEAQTDFSNTSLTFPFFIFGPKRSDNPIKISQLEIDFFSQFKYLSKVFLTLWAGKAVSRNGIFWCIIHSFQSEGPRTSAPRLRFPRPHPEDTVLRLGDLKSMNAEPIKLKFQVVESCQTRKLPN